MLKNSRHARACVFIAFCSAFGTLNAAPNLAVSSGDTSVPPAGYQSTFSTYHPITENVSSPDKLWRAANDAVAASPMGGMQMGGGSMTVPMGGSKSMSMGKPSGHEMSMPMEKGMVMPAKKTPTRKNTAPAPMKMNMKKGMSMRDMPMEKGMVMPEVKQKKRQETAPMPMKMPMKKGMSMEGMSMPMDDKMPSMDMHKGMGK